MGIIIDIVSKIIAAIISGSVSEPIKKTLCKIWDNNKKKLHEIWHNKKKRLYILFSAAIIVVIGIIIYHAVNTE
jgi:uncharacterized BrkB/YihY/UPF0761 family membrane protein